MANHQDRYTNLMPELGALGKAIPGAEPCLGQPHPEAGVDGSLDGRVKELIALGIAVAAGGQGDIVRHVQDSLTAGASRGEIREALGIAVLMGGRPTVGDAREALEALDDLTPSAAGPCCGFCGAYPVDGDGRHVRGCEAAPVSARLPPRRSSTWGRSGSLAPDQGRRTPAPTR